MNGKLVDLYCSDGRLEEAVNHCLAVENAGVLCNNLEWYTTVVCTLQVSRSLSSFNTVLIHCLYSVDFCSLLFVYKSDLRVSFLVCWNP